MSDKRGCYRHGAPRELFTREDLLKLEGKDEAHTAAGPTLQAMWRESAGKEVSRME